MTSPHDRAVSTSTAFPAPSPAALARLAALLGTGMIVVSGCSGADPADVAKVADRYSGSANPLSVPVTDAQARCRAKAYLESDLSEGALDDVRAGKSPVARNESDVEVLASLATELAECV